MDNFDIAIAGLLHDIGKVVQRAGVPIKDSLKGQESVFCKDQGNYYSYKHALYTVQFLEDNLKMIIDENVINIAAKHHVPSNELEDLLAKADRLSAGMDRRENEASKKGNYINERLYSIFESINIGKEYQKQNYYYNLIPLNSSEEIFPVKEEKEDVEKSKKEYENILKAIEEDINKEIDKDSFLSTPNHKERMYNKLYYILEKYTTFIPSSTIDYPDISLFDHLKTTSAIAVCLYELYKNNEQKDKKFILLEGDISGIQNFIFQVTEGEETKKYVSKNLRGRSFYINVLIDFMSKYIVRKLGLTISNILYCGGGKFQLLLPNTDKIISVLEEIKLDIQKYLYRNYKTKLGLVLSYIEVDEEGIKDYSSSLVKLQEKTLFEKNRKFIDIINIEKDQFFVKNNKINNLCKYCHENEAKTRLFKNERMEICDECFTHIQLGEMLVKNRLKYIVYDFDNSIKDADLSVKFGQMGQVCFYSQLKNNNVGFMIENINGTGDFGRIKFVGNTVPVKERSVASFNEIGAMAEGEDKIAVLKMDIDNLGTIFSTGLKDENKSISRISTLSRMIDLFFCGYINKICEDLYEEYLKEKEREEVELDNLYYINFSGGDDLAIIGPWDWTIKLAMRIKEKLTQFVCYNPNITVSAGVYFADPKMPIRISLHEGERYLDIAKDNKTKDSICIFEKAFRWNEGPESVEKVMKDAELYTKWLKEKKLSRNLAFNIMVASKNIKRKGNINFDLIPIIAYSISRNVSDDNVRKELINRLITKDIKNSEIEFVKYPLMIALMKTRKVEEV